MDIYEKEKALMNLKAKVPKFDEEEIVEYTKNVIPNIHIFLSQEKIDKVSKYCSEEVINKLKSNKKLYRISNNIDSIRVVFARLEGYNDSNEKIQIKIYASIFFYDDVDNNEISEETVDRYWNDIWIITYELEGNKDIINKCPSCGATMGYSSLNHMFTCDYCRNSLYFSQIEWKIVDMEVQEASYNQ